MGPLIFFVLFVAIGWRGGILGAQLRKDREMITEREVLRDDVIEQIKKDVESGDFTAIYELIMELPDKTLLAFLSEGAQND